MKNLTLTILLSFFAISISISAQEYLEIDEIIEMPTNTEKVEEIEGEVFVVVEQMPEFPGGQEAMFKYIFENLKYPVEAKASKQEGLVVTSFVIFEDGSVNNVKIVRSPSPLFNAEAKRVIENMPNWKAGVQRGKKVKVHYNLPLRFKLDDKDLSEEAEAISIAEESESKVYENPEKIDKMPVFPGGEMEMLKHIAQNTVYPKEAKDAGEEGRVILQLVIYEDGSVNEVEVARGTSPLLDAEAKRVVESLPDFEPGLLNGEKVRVRYHIPIRFKLDGKAKKKKRKGRKK